jgi:hypothetical protein
MLPGCSEVDGAPAGARKGSRRDAFNGEIEE